MRRTETYAGVTDRKMIKKLFNILALAVLSAASLSCSKALLSDYEEALKGEFTIAVNGVVSDVAANSPIKDINVTFSAYAENAISVLPLSSMTVKTGVDGTYSIEMSGFSDPVTCIIQAESDEESDQQYESMSSEIVVTWAGNSFDPERKTFFVNDCNFQMEKKN